MFWLPLTKVANNTTFSLTFYLYFWLQRCRPHQHVLGVRLRMPGEVVVTTPMPSPSPLITSPQVDCFCSVCHATQPTVKLCGAPYFEHRIAYSLTPRNKCFWDNSRLIVVVFSFS